MSLKGGQHHERASLDGHSGIGVGRVTAMLPLATLVPSLHSASFFSIESTCGQPGATVVVPVTLRGETNVVAAPGGHSL